MSASERVSSFILKPLPWYRHRTGVVYETTPPHPTPPHPTPPHPTPPHPTPPHPTPPHPTPPHPTPPHPTPPHPTPPHPTPPHPTPPHPTPPHPTPPHPTPPHPSSLNLPPIHPFVCLCVCSKVTQKTLCFVFQSDLSQIGFCQPFQVFGLFCVPK